MRVQIRTVGDPSMPTITWPDGWPLPRLDDEIASNDGISRYVRAVVWYPDGDDDSPEPFVYIVVGPLRAR